MPCAGYPPVDGAIVVAGLADALPGGADALDGGRRDGPRLRQCGRAARAVGLLGGGGSGDGGGGALPDRMAPVLALVEALPGPLTERLLVELLARVVEPPRR